ncbi:DUF6702 family protein [Algoriphagus sp.]|uniref:DUF6702 family protein n=1 Tax=Algoriphagus sp. TaxID=1872435 RepID=UPI003F70B20C
MQQYYILMLNLGWLVFAHPFHLSLTEIKYNRSSERLEISQKIFWDDLEIALSAFHDTPIDFLNPAKQEELDKQIESYLKEKTKIWVKGKIIPMNFLGYEIEEDAAWFYLESGKVQETRSIKVQNAVLTDDFSDQKNVVQFFSQEGRPKSIILSKDSDTGLLDF